MTLCTAMGFWRMGGSSRTSAIPFGRPPEPRFADFLEVVLERSGLGYLRSWDF